MIPILEGDNMKLFLLISLIALFSYTSAYSQTDTTKADSTQIETPKEVPPDFTDVDVIVETEWSEPEKTSNVNVYLHLKDEHPHITMSPNSHQQCDIRIIKGITIKILDSKTGKLLKKYTVESLSQ